MSIRFLICLIFGGFRISVGLFTRVGKRLFQCYRLHVTRRLIRQSRLRARRQACRSEPQGPGARGRGGAGRGGRRHTLAGGTWADYELKAYQLKKGLKGMNFFFVIHNYNLLRYFSLE